MSTTTLRVRAYAKINWSLEVTGRRDDGYHELVTVLQTVAVADVLDVTSADHDLLVVRGGGLGGVPHGSENLVSKALDHFKANRRAHGSPAARYAIALEKRIPAAAGLGGGSSDAAATLRALNRLTTGSLATEDLESVAATLGSDVAFFVRGGTQLATGRGERLSPLPDPPTTWIVLVTPPLAPAEKTARLYGLLTADHYSDGSQTRAIGKQLQRGSIPAAGALINAFERVAARAFPGLDRYREQLRARCGAALLCGAGPSLFAPVSDQTEAERATYDLRANGLRARAVQTVTAAESTAFECIQLDGPVDILK